MKQTYFGRTPILTLLTFFALVLGSQWTFGQTYTFDTSTENFTPCLRDLTTVVNNADNSELKYYRAANGENGTIGGGNKYGIVSPEITFENGKTYQISYEHYGSVAMARSGTDKFIGILHPEQDYYSGGTYDCNNKDWRSNHTLISHDTESTKTSYSAYYTNNTGSDIIKPLAFRTQKMNLVHYFDNIIVKEVPNVSITSNTVNDEGSTTSSTHNFTFTTSQDVTGFEASDINLTNCTISNFTEITASNYSATITASSEGAINISIEEGEFNNASGFGNKSNSFSFSYSAAPCNVTLGDASYTCGEYDESTNTYSYTATLDVVNSDPSNTYTLSTNAGNLSTDVIVAGTITPITVTLNDTTTNSFTLSIDECALVTKNYTTTCNYMIGEGTSSFWYKDAHWTKGTVPITSDDVIITSAQEKFTNGKDKVKTDFSAVNSFTIESGAHFQLTQANDGSYGDATINGDFTNNGTLTIGGDFEASGNITNNSNSTININETAYLSGNDMTNNGTITIKSNATNHGNLKVNSVTTINSVTTNGTVNYELHTPITVRDGAFDTDDLSNVTVKVGLITPPLDGMKFGEVIDNNTDLLTAWKYNNGEGAKKLFGPYVNGAYSNFFSDGSANGDDETNDATLITPGKGYRASLYQGKNTNNGDLTSDGLLEFTGNILTGNQSADVGSNEDGYDGWDLIGNPYTSGLSLKAFVSENNNLLEELTTGITYWDNTLNTPAFVTKTKVELDAADGDIVIPPGQAFFVRPNTGTSSLNFKADQQQIQNGASFNRNSYAFEGFNITLSNSDVDKSTKVYLNNNTTLGVDKGHEAAAIGLSTKGMGIYTLIADQSRTEALAIQSIPGNNIENTSLKLGVNAGLGEHTLSLEGINLPENLNVYVTDLANGSETLLNKKVYTFNVTDTPLEGADRFIISFQSDALSTVNNSLEELQITAFKNTITVKGDLKYNTTLKVYDLQGRKVAQTALSNNNRQLTVNNSAGVYVVSISNTQGSKTQKVILK